MMRLRAMRVSACDLDRRFFRARVTEIERAAVVTAAACRLFCLGCAPVAAAGLVRIDDGRLFLFFDVADGRLGGAGHAKLIIDTAREMLSEAGEPVWTPCHETKYLRAPKLVALCGFESTEEYIEDARVWLKLP